MRCRRWQGRRDRIWSARQLRKIWSMACFSSLRPSAGVCQKARSNTNGNCSRMLTESRVSDRTLYPVDQRFGMAEFNQPFPESRPLGVGADQARRSERTLQQSSANLQIKRVRKGQNQMIRCLRCAVYGVNRVLFNRNFRIGGIIPRKSVHRNVNPFRAKARQRTEDLRDRPADVACAIKPNMPRRRAGRFNQPSRYQCRAHVAL